MKLRNHQFSTQPQIFERYKHPWYEHNEKIDKENKLIKPNPHTKEAIEKAKFVDKTYEWDRSDSLRSRNKRST